MSNIVTNEMLPATAAATVKRQAVVVIVVSSTAKVGDDLVAGLRNFGYRVLAIEFSAEVGTYQRLQPSLIIADCSPERWCAHGMIRALETARKIPVIFLIDAVHGEAQRPTGLYASSDVLARPFSIAQLEARVRRSLEVDRSDDCDTRLSALLEQRRDHRRESGWRRSDGSQAQTCEHDRRQGARRGPSASRGPIVDLGQQGASGALLALAGVTTISVLVTSARRALISQLGAALMGEHGFHLTGACIATSEDLRAFVGERSADLIMVDTALIAGVGVESLRAIRDVAPRVRLVLLWDDAYPLAVEEVVRRGITGCIPVSASLRQYARAIHEMNQGSLWLPRWIMEQVFRQSMKPLLREAVPKAGAELASDGVAFALLTAREELIARLAAQGKTNKEIAKDLNVSPDTIKKHLQAVYHKIGVHRRGQLSCCLPTARATPCG